MSAQRLLERSSVTSCRSMLGLRHTPTCSARCPSQRGIRRQAATAWRQCRAAAKEGPTCSQKQPQEEAGPLSNCPQAEQQLPHNWMAPSSMLFLWALQLAGPALALEGPNPGFSQSSYITALGLFVISLPGLWSLVKRAPKSKRVQKTFAIEGPGQAGSATLDSRARQIFAYFKKYNYNVKETGEVIRFIGNYKASRGQAAALVFYVFVGLASTALVLSIAAPVGGSWWYGLTLLSPLAGVYYFQRGTREEEFAIKMVTADDDSSTDVIVEGDQEEVMRLSQEMAWVEKGKVRVKGLLEQS